MLELNISLGWKKKPIVLGINWHRQINAPVLLLLQVNFYPRKQQKMLELNFSFGLKKQKLLC